MFWISLPLFAAYAACLWTEELLFRRKRGARPGERLWKAIETLTLTLSVGVTVGIEFDDDTQIFCMIPAALSTALVLRNAYFHAASGTPGEQLVHAVVCLLHLAVLAAAMVVWNFIDGAGLFLGMVLPFSTDGLRELATGNLVVLGALALYQSGSWLASRRTARKAPALPEPAQAEADRAA